MPGQNPFRLQATANLVDWIEARLNGALGQIDGLDKQLNAEMADAGACPVDGMESTECLDDPLAPFAIEEGVGNISINRISNSPAILVEVSTPISCGSSSRAYIFIHESGQKYWRRAWTLSDGEGWDNNTTVSEGLGTGKPALIAVAGDNIHCNSVWETGRYRVWLADGELRRIQEVSNESRSTTIDGPLGAVAEIEGDHVTVSWSEGKRIATYAMVNGKYWRLPPFGSEPGAKGYVLEWLRNSWTDIEHWSDFSPSIARLRDQHERMIKIGMGQPSFTYETADPFSESRCSEKSLWQVKIDAMSGEESSYFLLRAADPDSYKILRIANQEFPECRRHWGKGSTKPWIPFDPASAFARASINMGEMCDKITMCGTR